MSQSARVLVDTDKNVTARFDAPTAVRTFVYVRGSEAPLTNSEALRAAAVLETRTTD